jgi:uncharacterized protein (UPF0332 family)
MLIDARETRELADYTVEEEISAETALLRVKNAEEFIRIVKTLIAEI